MHVFFFIYLSLARIFSLYFAPPISFLMVRPFMYFEHFCYFFFLAITKGNGKAEAFCSGHNEGDT